jgi:hypothetical protein
VGTRGGARFELLHTPYGGGAEEEEEVADERRPPVHQRMVVEGATVRELVSPAAEHREVVAHRKEEAGREAEAFGRVGGVGAGGGEGRRRRRPGGVAAVERLLDDPAELRCGADEDQIEEEVGKVGVELALGLPDAMSGLWKGIQWRRAMVAVVAVAVPLVPMRVGVWLVGGMAARAEVERLEPPQ